MIRLISSVGFSVFLFANVAQWMSGDESVRWDTRFDGNEISVGARHNSAEVAALLPGNIPNRDGSGVAAGGGSVSGSGDVASSIRSCVVVVRTARVDLPYDAALDTCAGDNGALLEGVFEYRDPSTGELVRVDEPVTIYVTQADLQRLPIEAGTVHVGGWSGEWLVNYPMPVHTDAAAHTVATMVLGIPVEVRVTPTEFVWDYGHGVAVITSGDPGAPYPDQTIEAAWDAAGPDRLVTLTTRWRGEFRVEGTGLWVPINGSATTTSTSQPVTVIEAPARLVPNP